MKLLNFIISYSISHYPYLFMNNFDDLDYMNNFDDLDYIVAV